MKMDKEYFEVCLCSLLHDIGKFAWRVASEESKKSHEEWNEEIVGAGGRDPNVKSSFSYWRKVNQPLNNCVWLGDWISAQERDDLDETEKMETKEEEFKRIKTTPLIRSFSLVSLKDEKKNVKEIYVKHKNLSLDFSLEEDFLSKEERLNHEFDKNLFNSFVKELKKVLSLDSDGLEEANKLRVMVFRNVLDILKKYLIYVPSATAHSKSDIDLYNHSKIACAITACLYKLYKSNGEKYGSFLSKLRKEMEEIFRRKKEIEKTSGKEKEKLKEQLKNYKINENQAYNEKIFLLIKGDFSGIQDFISTLSTEKAIAHLKARSFYLAFLNRLIPLKIIRDLDLLETNIIFADGGNFEILAPNLPGVKEEIKKISEKVNRFFWNHFGIKLFLDISCTKLSARDIDRDFFSEVFKENKNQQNIEIKEKQRKFYEILKEIIDEEGNQKIPFYLEECKICHKEIPKKPSDNEKEKMCDECKEFKKIRDKIKEWQEGSKIKEIESFLFEIEGKNLFETIKYYNSNRERTSYLFPYLNQIKGIYEIFATGLPLKEKEGEDKKKDIIEFDELAKKAQERTGTNKIAALKLDVDNLGLIFSKGLGKNLTLSLYSRLSFDINLFFSGILETLRNKDEFRDEIYIIYASGDDTLIIGSWDKVLDFAKEIIEYFRIYVNNHPDITVSASYNLFSPRYPVKKIFEIMEGYLDKAKNYSDNILDKGRISLFGIPIRWDIINEEKKELTEELIDKWVDKKEKINGKEEKLNEFEIVWIIHSSLNKLLKEGKLTRTFLSKIIFLADEILDYLMKEKPEANLIPVHRFTYYLKRTIKGGGNDEDFKILNKLWKEFCFLDINKRFEDESNSFRKNIKKLDLLKIATKIVLLKTRK